MPRIAPEVYRNLWSITQQLHLEGPEQVVVYPSRLLAEAWSSPAPPDAATCAASTRALWMILTDRLALPEVRSQIWVAVDLGRGAEPHDLVELRDGIAALRRRDPRPAEVGLFRAFGRMPLKAIAQATNVGHHAVSARWELARRFLVVWLHRKAHTAMGRPH